MRQSRARWTFSVPESGSNNFGQICICISIMSVVAYILGTAWNRPPKARMQGVSCMSNMKQIGLALQGYTEDYDGKFPSGCIVNEIALTMPSSSRTIGQPAANAGHTHGSGVGWAGSVSPYVKSLGIFKCPVDATLPSPGNGSVALRPISYAMNQWIAELPRTKLAEARTTILAFECSDDVVDLSTSAEERGTGHSPVGDGASDPSTGIPNAGDGFDSAAGVGHMVVNNRGQFARHDINGAGGGGSMYLLGDGHVKFLRFDQVSVGKSPVSQGMLGTAYTASFNPTK